MQNFTKVHYQKLLPIAFSLLVLGGIALTRIHSYLLFHSLAELFSIVIACGIFMITWNARTFLDNRYLLFIGIVYLFVGFMDALHTLAYSGLGVFEGYGANLPTQLWISARYLESFSLVGAFFLIRRSFHPYYILLAYAIGTAVLLSTIFHWEVFPDCFVEGTGLTQFKKTSEYIIAFTLFLAVALLYHKRNAFETYVARLLGASITVTIASELTFTLYTDPFGTANLLGHLLKIVSFIFIYMAIIETGLSNPYSLLFRNLQQNKDALEEALGNVEQRQIEIEALLASSRAILDNQVFHSAARAIFDSCRTVVGASSGYIALLSKDGHENEVLFLESGGLPCTVDPSLPMPIRGLREKAYRENRGVYDNRFDQSEWAAFLPEGHVVLENVLFAPLVIDGKVVGLLGLANKPGGFDSSDAQMTSAFAELAAVALRNSRTMEQLAESEQHFRSVAETAGDAIITADSQGNIFAWNRAAESMFGYCAEEVTGKSLTVLMPNEFHSRHQSGLDRAISTGESHIIGKTVELKGLRKDGNSFPLELSLARWEKEQDSFFTAIIRDITDRKITEEVLRNQAYELSKRLKELDCLYSISSLVDQIGISLDEILQETVHLIPRAWQYPEIACARISIGTDTYESAGFIQTEWKQMCPIIAHGEPCGSVEVYYQEERPESFEGPFSEEERKLISAISESLGTIIEKMRTEDALKASESNYRTLVESSPDGIINLDTTGYITDCNEGVSKLLGYPREEINGRNLREFVPYTIPANLKAYYEEAAVDGQLENEYELIGQDGEAVPVWAKTVPIYGSDNDPVQYVVYLRDIAVRRRMDQLKDEFIGLISHELRNPLTVIIGGINTALSERERLSPEEITQLLQDAASEAESLSHLIWNLLELSRSQANRLLIYPEPIRIDDITEQIVEKMQLQSPLHRFVMDFPDDCPPVHADQLRLERILHNLLENAVKYSPVGREIHISARTKTDSMVIGVSDEGDGISAEDLENLFDSFYRLREHELAGITGTGLGLSVCKILVEAHGGTVWVKSEPGQGSTFYFSLPRR